MLRGFEIETDAAQPADYPDYDPALGYTSRGFGMGLSAVDQESGTPAFDVHAQVRWGPRDRDDMNAAMRVAQTEVRVAWTAIGYSGTASHSSLTDAVDLNHTPPWSEQSGLSLETSLTGGPGIAGITSFDLGVSDQDGGDGGDYLRSFGVELDLAEDASAPQSVQTEVLTTSAIELGTWPPHGPLPPAWCLGFGQLGVMATMGTPAACSLNAFWICAPQVALACHIQNS